MQHQSGSEVAQPTLWGWAVTIERLGAWLTVARALADMLDTQVTDLRVIDFWATANGLRVAYQFRGEAVELQQTIPMSRDAAAQLVDLA